MTPLGAVIIGLIEAEGPISVARYMGLCLGHPRHGYYMTRDPLGRGGDFTTAPEISQMFGEMLGVWAVSVWDAMGRPNPCRLIEFGPGRGTLMADVLRAAKALPGFLPAATVHLVEISPVLRQAQERALAGCGVPVTWHRDAADLPEGPAIMLANEFFDALPIRQFAFTGGGWRERLIGLDGAGKLMFGLAGAVADIGLPPGEDGDIREVCPQGIAIMAGLARRLAGQGGALLAIDYGYGRTRRGESLQAMQAHGFVDPLQAPGEADITAHVDFAALARAAKSGGASVHPLLTQATLLRRLGIETRSAALAQANPARAAEFDAALLRLIGAGQGQMGTLFKALAVAQAGLMPPGFDSPDALINKIGE